jgi:hypothetical protein
LSPHATAAAAGGFGALEAGTFDPSGVAATGALFAATGALLAATGAVALGLVGAGRTDASRPCPRAWPAGSRDS